MTCSHKGLVVECLAQEARLECCRNARGLNDPPKRHAMHALVEALKLFDMTAPGTQLTEDDFRELDRDYS